LSVGGTLAETPVKSKAAGQPHLERCRQPRHAVDPSRGKRASETPSPGRRCGRRLTARVPEGHPVLIWDVSVGSRPFDGSGFVVAQTFPLLPLTVVKDVVTTGEGMPALAHPVETSGGDVAGGAWFASRSTVDGEATIGAPTCDPMQSGLMDERTS
jgi:hypothetical protein